MIGRAGRDPCTPLLHGSRPVRFGQIQMSFAAMYPNVMAGPIVEPAPA